MTPLTLEQWQMIAMHMQDLVTSDAWGAYMGRLEVAETEYMEKLLADEPLPSGKREREYWAGFVAGLRYVATHPNRIIDRARRMTEDAANTPKDSQ